eukprot:scaffold2123_cov111-Isochrysis_galbana.AAC.1
MPWPASAAPSTPSPHRAPLSRARRGYGYPPTPLSLPQLSLVGAALERELPKFAMPGSLGFQVPEQNTTLSRPGSDGHGGVRRGQRLVGAGGAGGHAIRATRRTHQFPRGVARKGGTLAPPWPAECIHAFAG